MDLEIQLGKGDSQRNFICRDHAEMYLDSWNYLQTSSISADNCRNLRPAGKDGQEDFIKVLCCNGTIKIFFENHIWKSSISLVTSGSPDLWKFIKTHFMTPFSAGPVYNISVKQVKRSSDYFTILSGTSMLSRYV